MTRPSCAKLATDSGKYIEKILSNNNELADLEKNFKKTIIK